MGDFFWGGGGGGGGGFGGKLPWFSIQTFKIKFYMYRFKGFNVIVENVTVTSFGIPFNFSCSATSLLMYVFVLASSNKAFTVILTLPLLTITVTVLNEINSSTKPKSWFVTVVWDLSSFCCFFLHFLDSCCSVLFPDCSFSVFFNVNCCFQLDCLFLYQLRL